MPTASCAPIPICRPGERLIRGEVWVFDQGLLNLHLAREACAAMPVDLLDLTDDELADLNPDAVRVSWEDNDRTYLRRIEAERRRRGIDSSGVKVAA